MRSGLVVIAAFACVTAAMIGALPVAARADVLFVSNINTGTIGEYDTSGNPINASLITGLNGAVGMAVSGDDIFVTNGNVISEYTTSGALVNASLVTGLTSPAQIAISGNDLFVTDGHFGGYGSGTVGEYDTSGNPINVALVTGLTNPDGLAVSGGDLFVGNGSTVGEYDTSGNPINPLLITGGGFLPNIAVSGGDIFVPYSGYYGGGVDEYDTLGNYISGFSSGYPEGGLALSGSDLFVAYNNNTVGEYSISGSAINASLITGLNNPIAIAIATPEPSTLILLAIGVAAVCFAARPRR